KEARTARQGAEYAFADRVGIARPDGGGRLRIIIRRARHRVSAGSSERGRELAGSGIHGHGIPRTLLHQLSSVSESVPADGAGTVFQTRRGVNNAPFTARSPGTHH